ncbi:ABC transporter substrate-binding protein [Amycolatopsis sp. GM8]|uniref:ABC transporter substrate-binding protein n=1 Tax=Amycolatopsis sp. GM8 TaxID=2896530 RepID=UPI001F45FB05|nr:ABC transporter substrate-binding protein [Amycolatopsis sp. GM8]
MLSSSSFDRRSFIRAAAAAGLVVGVPTLASCAGDTGSAYLADAKPPVKPTGVLRVANNAEPQGLDPVISSGVADAGIFYNNVYETLLMFKPGVADVEPLLAESYQMSPDAREWTFRLKSGIKFHDGEPFTSSAMKKSYEHYVASASYSALPFGKAQFDDSDPLTFRITSAQPIPDMARFAANVAAISPKLLQAGSDAVKKNPVGTGPFRFVSYVPAQKVILEANPDYRGPGPYLERIEFPIIPDADARTAALRSKSVDLVMAASASSSQPLRNDRSLVVSENQIWKSSKLLMFNDAAPLDNPKVRQALAFSIDRQAIVKTILGGAASVDDGWTVPGIYGFQNPKMVYPYDPNRAKSLLAESGLPTPVSFTLAWFPEILGPEYGRAAQAIAAMAEKVGINITVKTVPTGDLSRVIATPAGAPRPWQAYLSYLGFNFGTAAHLLATKTLEKAWRYLDPTFLQLETQVLGTPDGPERLAQFAQIEENIAQNVPLISLWTHKQIDATSARVHGYQTSNTGERPRYGEVFLAD